MFSRVPNLLSNEVFSETRGHPQTLGRHGWLWKHSLFISSESENVLQGTQSYLKWSLLWNEIFSETRGHLRTLQRCGWLWIHSLFISPESENILQGIQSYLKWSLLWNEVFSELKSSLKLVVVSNSSKVWLALNTFTLHFPVENVLQSTKSSLKLVAIFELFVRPAFDFPDRLDFFSLRTLSHFRTRECLWTVRPAFNFLDRLEFF